MSAQSETIEMPLASKEQNSEISASINGNKEFIDLPPFEALFELLCVFSVLYLPYILKMLAVGIDMSKYSQPLAAEQYVSIFSQGILSTLIIGFILHKNRQPISSIGLHFNDISREIAVAIIAFFGIITSICIIGMIAFFVLDSNQIKEINQNNTEIAKMFVNMPVWAVPLFCIFVGYYEELVFRGFFITRLRSLLHNDWLAIIIAGAVFASAHFYEGIFKMIMIFGLACVLGGIFIIRKSLIAPIIIHTLFNFTFIMLAKSAFKIIKHHT